MVNYWIISTGTIAVLGVLLFFYFSTRRKYRDATAALNYEKFRNKISLRPDEVIEEDDRDSPDSFGVGIGLESVMSVVVGLVVLSIIILVSMTMLSTMSDVITASVNMTSTTVYSGVQANVTSTAINAFVDMMPPIFTILGVIMIVSVIIMIMRFLMGAEQATDQIDDLKQKQRNKKGIKHYTEIRDKLSRRK